MEYQWVFGMQNQCGKINIGDTKWVYTLLTIGG